MRFEKLNIAVPQLSLPVPLYDACLRDATA
jgi:hypothetical protein